MKQTNLVLSVVLTSFIVTSCVTKPKNNYKLSPARRYMDLPEYKLSLKRTIYPFQQKECIIDLKLTRKQINALNKAFKTNVDSIPGSKELNEEKKEVLFNSVKRMTCEENIQYRSEWDARRAALIHSYIKDSINSILTDKQKQRLKQIRIQTRGPLIIHYDKNVAKSLEIAPEQQKKITAVVDEYDKRLYKLRKKAVDLMNLKSMYIDKAKRKAVKKKEDALLKKTIQIIFERDQKIISCLTKDQVEKLKTLEGKHINVRWVGFADALYDPNNYLYRWNSPVSKKVPAEINIETYRSNPTSDPDDPKKVYIPKDVEDAVKELQKMLCPAYIEEFKQLPEKDIVRNFEHGGGLDSWIDKNWDLGQPNRLTKFFYANNITYNGKMRKIIITTFWRKINGQPLLIDEQLGKKKKM